MKETAHTINLSEWTKEQLVSQSLFPPISEYHCREDLREINGDISVDCLPFELNQAQIVRYPENGVHTPFGPVQLNLALAEDTPIEFNDPPLVFSVAVYIPSSRADEFSVRTTINGINYVGVLPHIQPDHSDMSYVTVEDWVSETDQEAEAEASARPIVIPNTPDALSSITSVEYSV